MICGTLQDCERETVASRRKKSREQKEVSGAQSKVQTRSYVLPSSYQSPENFQ